MSIIRHEIRKISDENRGQPIISQAVVHGNVAYFAGITPTRLSAISKRRQRMACAIRSLPSPKTSATVYQRLAPCSATPATA